MGTTPSVLGLRPSPPPPMSPSGLLGEETTPSVLGLRPSPPSPTSPSGLLGEETGRLAPVSFLLETDD